MFPIALTAEAVRLLEAYRRRSLRLVTAESCTGGLVCGLLTEIAGSSDVVDRGFVTYSNHAKERMLGVPTQMLSTHGAVSQAVALAMAAGALAKAQAHVAVSITGVAGPAGGSTAKPVGLVHFGLAKIGHPTTHLECRFGDVGRELVRLKAIEVALDLFWRAIRGET